MKDKFSALKTLALSFLTTMVVYTAFSTFEYLKVKNFSEITLQPSDFEINSMVEIENGYVSTDSDPQFVLNGEIKCYYLTFKLKSSLCPGRISVFYTTAPGEDYNPKKMVRAVPVEGEENVYGCKVSDKTIYSLRIDPTVSRGNLMEISDFTLNRNMALGLCLKPEASDWLNIIVISAMLAGAAEILKNLGLLPFKKTETGEK